MRLEKLEACQNGRPDAGGSTLLFRAGMFILSALGLGLMRGSSFNDPLMYFHVEMYVYDLFPAKGPRRAAINVANLMNTCLRCFETTDHDSRT